MRRISRREFVTMALAAPAALSALGREVAGAKPNASRESESRSGLNGWQERVGDEWRRG